MYGLSQFPSAGGKHMLSFTSSIQSAGLGDYFASPGAYTGEHKNWILNALGIKEQQIALIATVFDIFISDLQPDIVLFDDRFYARRAAFCFGE